MFPEAELKIFLVANAEERANRRHLELTNKGEEVSKEEILKTCWKDKIDLAEGKSAKKPEDSIEIDTSGKSIVEVKEKILKLLKKI